VPRARDVLRDEVYRLRRGAVMKKQMGLKLWGHCGHCRYFSSPAKAPLDGEQASCKEPSLAAFELRVAGTCGCNLFELRPGLPTTVEEPRVQAR
jgi:hypothetical protein